MKKYFLLAGLICLVTLQVKSQNQLIRTYGTQEYMRKLISNSKETRETIAANERMGTKKKKVYTSKDDGQFTLPLVFHLLFNQKKDQPTKSQVTEQVSALNTSFDVKSYKIKHKADTAAGFSKKVVNTGISFCLANKAPNGKATDGINEVNTSVLRWGFNNNMKFLTSGGQEAWDTKEYINIWVVDLADSISGFAQMPGGPGNTDGIVIDKRFFGINGLSKKPYAEGKTLTHLIANYLDVHDLWNENQDCGDDLVEDTPIHNAPNFGNYPYKHVSTCDNYPVEMLTNYMDNTPDSIQSFFTIGQKNRMQFCVQPGGSREMLTLTVVKCKNNQIPNPIPLIELKQTVTFKTEVSIYPNPSNDQFTIYVKTGVSDLHIGSCSIVNNQGVEMLTQPLDLDNGSSLIYVNTSTWASGIYFARIVSMGNPIVKKIIVQK